MRQISDDIRQQWPVYGKLANNLFAQVGDIHDRSVPQTGATSVIHCHTCGAPVVDHPVAIERHTSRMRHKV